MKRRDFLKYLGAVGAASFVPKLTQKAFAAGINKPNIILVHADDLGWADVNYNAPHDWYETPNIDALKNAGMSFTNGYAAAALCSPTRAALMTGRYPPRTGVTNFIHYYGTTNPDGYYSNPDQEYQTPLRYIFLESSEVTVAEAIKPAGYSTYHVGKWHLGAAAADQLPDEQGFDVQLMGECPVDYWDPYDSCPSLPSRDPGEYLTDRLTDEAINFIQTAHGAGNKFFLYLPHHAVHTPIQAKADYESYFNSKPKPTGWEHLDATYAAMIKSLDDSVGNLVAELDSLGITNDTLFIFTSDNGGHLGTGAADNTPLRKGKRWPYEGGIREPWIFKWPGVIEAGSTCDEPINSIDVMPTLCDIVGERLPSGVEIDGVSLWPLLKKQATKLKERDIFWYFPHYITDPTGAISPFAIVRRGKWKLIRWYDSSKPAELYDLDSDISETTDLASTYPDKVKHLQEKLDMWLASVGAKIPKKNPDYTGAQPEKKEVKVG